MSANIQTEVIRDLALPNHPSSFAKPQSPLENRNLRKRDRLAVLQIYRSNILKEPQKLPPRR